MCLAINFMTENGKTFKGENLTLDGAHSSLLKSSTDYISLLITIG